ncbi:SGNH/GDSL hydrolase family protein [Cyclobacterium sp.]|uniref:SGNH/GDSL hydrolase family protein n=1 Tax=Cyclobacterium sp. TaxID=1966343 RepID=UPI0019A2A2CD|nr:SGNH/GDSL hydrolase family protein [Cyclobacterium sp.]MBD3629042.1 SGNH/GDSL hydrolase family protein [Cyclobacterium sp.]
MKIRSICYTFVLLVSPLFASFGQEHLNWINPLKSGNANIVHGQGEGATAFSRLPESMEDEVRGPVWGLSRHAAGLKLKFATDAKKITIRYTVSRAHGMPHMPATGVSGLDLYTKSDAGQWIWVKGNYSFADTIKYEFPIVADLKGNRNFDLYLPLYNEVLFLEIGLPDDAEFDFILNDPAELPLVVYGTSIAQGACASRPGMAWTAILERNLNLPLINLGFSGNGQLEDPLITYLGKIESSIYILDCLPNLVRDSFDEKVVKERIVSAVNYLKEKRPDTPILLVDHAGYTDDLINKDREEAYQLRNLWSRQAYEQLVAGGVEELYYLSRDGIGLSMDATVDGTHPSDLGMDQYARGYTALIKEILNK